MKLKLTLFISILGLSTAIAVPQANAQVGTRSHRTAATGVVTTRRAPRTPRVSTATPTKPKRVKIQKVKKTTSKINSNLKRQRTNRIKKYQIGNRKTPHGSNYHYFDKKHHRWVTKTRN